MGRVYRILLAGAVWALLGLQYWLMIDGQPPPEVAQRTINFFSYFTVLCNLLVAVTVTAPVLAPKSGLDRWLAGPAPRAAVAGFIAIVCATYHLILRDLWDPQGLQMIADYGLHYAVPILFVLDWLLLVPKGTLRLGFPLHMLPFPLLYAVWTLVHGAFSGFWPYPFVDADKLGMQRVLLNMGGFVLIFLVVGAVVLIIDRLLGLLRRDRKAGAA